MMTTSWFINRICFIRSPRSIIQKSMEVDRIDSRKAKKGCDQMRIRYFRQIVHAILEMIKRPPDSSFLVRKSGLPRHTHISDKSNQVRMTATWPAVAGRLRFWLLDLKVEVSNPPAAWRLFHLAALCWQRVSFYTTLHTIISTIKEVEK